MINLTPILQALIGLLAAFVTYRIIPMIKARTSLEQQARIRAAVNVAIFAAEQIYGAGNGDAKLDYAIKWLEDNGYHVSRAEIEAAVYEAFNKEKPPEAIENPVG